MRKIVLNIFAIGALILTSCSENMSGQPEIGNGTDNVPATICESFSETYSGAENVVWTLTDEYAVASFSECGDGASLSVWYALKDCKRKMQRRTVAFEALPDAVIEAFETGDYASWSPEHKADVLTRYDAGVVETVYVLSAVSYADGVKSVVDLYYTADGLLIKSIVVSEYAGGRDYGKWLPKQVPEKIAEYIALNYPDARCLDTDVDRDGTRVEILDGRTVRKLLFDVDGNWVWTKTSLHYDQIPEEILDSFRSSDYSSYILKGAVEFRTAANGTYYRFELKSRRGDRIEIFIYEDGTIEGDDPERNDFQYSSIDEFIDGRYPGAVIKDTDYDNDKIKVEIIYEGTEIEIEFDGDGRWVGSEWNIDIYAAESLVPEAVIKTIADKYAGYRLYFMKYVETSARGDWYVAGLRSGHSYKQVLFNEDGTVKAEYGH